MNTKTTLVLATALIVLGAVYYVIETRPEQTDTDTAATSTISTSQGTRSLLEEELGDVVTIACKHSDGEEWVFEKQAGLEGGAQDTWRMTSPLEMKVAKWEIDRFPSRIKNLRYELSYKAGAPGAVSAAKAGLEPPVIIVTLTDADDKTVTVEIGRAASNRETYVRLAGSEEICVAKSDLTGLLKERAIEYRDKQLWDFVPGNATRVEIVDRSEADAPLTYIFNRDGTRWMMASPVTARATSKVDDLVRSISRLRVTDWRDDDADGLAAYGLDPATLTIRLTVEETVPAEQDAADDLTPEGEEAEPEEEPTETIVTIHELHVSDRSPIAEGTKTYLRVGEETAVATVMKTMADKFKPVMSEWREMRISPVDVARATRIETTTPEGGATLVKTAGQWSFDGDSGSAEASSVSELLSAIADLSAVTFIDQPPADFAEFGLDRPRAQIRLTIPGVEGVELIAVGGYTDETTKRLVYVRRNELASVAKVRTPDVAKLLNGPHTYRDRTIVNVLPSRFETISLSAKNQFDAGRSELKLQRSDGTWSLIEPAIADIQQSQMDKLVESLGGLRAELVVTETAEPSAFGLHAPDVTLTLAYKPEAVVRIQEPEPEESGDSQQAARPVEIQPPSETLELSVTPHDGKYYLKRSDRGTIYEVTKAFYEQLLAEYRTDRVLDFDADKARSFSIRKGDQTHVFTKQHDRWVYEAEPDLPLDSTKVENLLLQIRDLRTQRYVHHVVEDLSQYGLSKPAQEVNVILDDDTRHTLWVSQAKVSAGSHTGFYAAVSGVSGVFIMTPDSVKRFEVSLDNLELAP